MVEELAFSVGISLNLAMFNLLPFPPLDGGRIAFAVLQKIYRPIVRIQTPVALVGWAFMLALIGQTGPCLSRAMQASWPERLKTPSEV